jgi:hypothetical protein
VADLIDTTGARLDWAFRQGEQFTRTITLTDGNDAAITNISSARIGFFTGTLAAPLVAVTGVTVTCTVTSSTTITFTLTSTHTRAFTVGNDYCYVMEATYSDGTIESELQGSISAFTEIA